MRRQVKKNSGALYIILLYIMLINWFLTIVFMNYRNTVLYEQNMFVTQVPHVKCKQRCLTYLDNSLSQQISNF